MAGRKLKVAAAAVALVGLTAAAMGARTTPFGRHVVTRVNTLSAAIAGRLGRGAMFFSTASLPPAPPSEQVEDSGTRLHIIVFKEEPVAVYEGEIVGLAPIPRIASGPSAGRVNVKSAAAINYAHYVAQQQLAHEAELSRLASRPVRVRARMQHALNAIIAEVTPADADRMRKDPSVLMIDEYRELPLASDSGAQLIGSEAVWYGNGDKGDYMPGYRGEGTVVGIIDTGINFGSPSFAAVSPLDGYTHINPLGAGTYLGTCAPGGVDEGRCNSKLIGGYDFVCNLAPDSTQPAQTYCTQTATYREEPGFGDTNGHGSHTASTAAGNARNVVFNNIPFTISGVAPRANIVAFDVCYTSVSTGQGSCPNTASVQAIDKAVQDGVVDVLNFSIGGGSSPWNDSVSLAFLNAVDAGIYVAAAAGNDGPGAGTVSHNEPWVSTTAAAQHGSGEFGYLLDVTGPGNVSPTLRSIVVTEGSGGATHSAAIPGTTPLRASAGLGTTNDGCASFPAGTFQGAIAVVRRGTCPFTDKVNNATAAGAIAVIIANNQPAPVSPSVPGTTVPVFSVTQADGDRIGAFFASNPTATASIGYPAVPLPNTPDALASFSSRGPGGTFSFIKPDITAPGVSILAVIAGTQITGSENIVGLLSGTSMASPHNAGAAALLIGQHPTWTPSEVKSALMMTSKSAVLMEDSVTAANPFARGAGRVQVAIATRAGLVMNETKANYLAANPSTGGNPATLNIPSLYNPSCYNTCTFTRTFRSTLSTPMTWNASVNGMVASVSPSTFTLGAGQSITLTVTARGTASGLSPDKVVRFGELTLVPSGEPASNPALHLPVGIAIQPPAISLSASTVNVTAPAGVQTGVDLTLANPGGALLSTEFRTFGVATASLMNQPVSGLTTGYRGSTFTDLANPPGQYSADDFVVGAPTQLSQLTANGFVVSGAALTSATSEITFSIYPDAGGTPSGNPSHPTNTAVWQYKTAPTGAGVATAGATISLNLAAAGQVVTLPAGTYWLAVSVKSKLADSWVWYATGNGSGSFATVTPAADGTGAWTVRTNFSGLAGSVNGVVTCGAGWMLGSSPNRALIEPTNNVSSRVLVSTVGLAPGSYSAYACYASNDPSRPVVPVRVNLTVTP